jgi:hypothetical protein
LAQRNDAHNRAVSPDPTAKPLPELSGDSLNRRNRTEAGDEGQIHNVLEDAVLVRCVFIHQC